MTPLAWWFRTPAISGGPRRRENGLLKPGNCNAGICRHTLCTPGKPDGARAKQSGAWCCCSRWQSEGLAMINQQQTNLDELCRLLLCAAANLACSQRGQLEAGVKAHPPPASSRQAAHAAHECISMAYGSWLSNPSKTTNQDDAPVQIGTHSSRRAAVKSTKIDSAVPPTDHDDALSLRVLHKLLQAVHKVGACSWLSFVLVSIKPQCSKQTICRCLAGSH